MLVDVIFHYSIIPQNICLILFSHVMNHMQALEKDVADAFPNASKKIQSVIKIFFTMSSPN
jgi:hypothetical protein